MKTPNGLAPLEEYRIFEKKCDKLLMMQKIRFAGVVNHLGHLVAGGFRNDIFPLEDDVDMRKLYMQLALKVSMRKDFDYCLGPVKFSVSRREKVVMFSFPLGNKFLLVSTEPDINIESTAKLILDKMKISI